MDIYPVTIIRARYQGVYEGGKWLAFNMEDVPTAVYGNDVDCSNFFYYHQDTPIGRGNTPNEAYDMLQTLLKDLDLPS